MAKPTDPRSWKEINKSLRHIIKKRRWSEDTVGKVMLTLSEPQKYEDVPVLSLRGIVFPEILSTLDPETLVDELYINPIVLARFNSSPRYVNT